MRTSHSSLVSVVLGKFGGLVGAGQTNRTTLISLCLINVKVAMGRFYFHLRAGDELISDDVGIDLPDLSAAKREAVLSARELLAEAIKSGRQRVPDAFVIADDEGRPLDIVSLAAVLPEPLKK
jgi:hypothetical protein